MTYPIKVIVDSEKKGWLYSWITDGNSVGAVVEIIYENNSSTLKFARLDEITIVHD